jgi:8-oxo-dGTP pyrophosphatase MutT (NUDIX family)
VQRELARALAVVLDEIASLSLPDRASQPQPAAVLVALDAPEDASTPAQLAKIGVLLTKRRPDLRRHGGEISLPGGRLEPADESLYATAVREAEEEIGLPRSALMPVGALAVVHTFSTNYAIYPFVALVDTRHPLVAAGRWRTSAREVDVVFKLSLGDLEAGRGRMRLERRGLRFETDTFTVGERVIWGATYRILDDLLQRLAQRQ